VFPNITVVNALVKQYIWHANICNRFCVILLRSVRQSDYIFNMPVGSALHMFLKCYYELPKPRLYQSKPNFYTNHE
jgi:hypothetical protein